jgi:simple sugar transport system permease protein
MSSVHPTQPVTELTEAGPPAGRSMTWRGRLDALGGRLSVSRELGPLVGCLLLLGAFEVASKGAFFSQLQITNVATVAAALSMVGTGATLLLIAGEFDLSVGTTFATVPVTWAILVLNWGLNPAIGFVLAMLVGLGIGAVNATLVVVARIPSFIVTLGMYYALLGIGLAVTGGVSYEIPPDALTGALGGKILGSPVTMQVAWAIGVAAFFWFVLEHTRYGNWIFATGSPGGAARSLGVPTRRVKFSLFLLCSALSGFAGCAVFSRLGTVTVGFGTDYNLLAIVACVVGGTSLFGASGTVAGTLIGAVLVSSIQPGLLQSGMGGTWYQAAIGFVLVVAVLFNIRFEAVRAKRVGVRR